MTADGAPGSGAAIERKLGPGWEDKLDAVLNRQLELYGELDALCDRQRGLIEAGDADRLMCVLSERSRVVEEITDVVDRFRPFAETWAEVRGALGEGALRDVQRRLDAVASLAASIAERDEEDTRAIAEKRDAFADELAGLGRKRQAARAYGGSRSAGPRFQDREG